MSNIIILNQKEPEIENMTNNIFSNDIKSYDYNELNGKTLKISVIDNEEITIVAGKDIEDNKVYILNYEVKENEI